MQENWKSNKYFFILFYVAYMFGEEKKLKHEKKVQKIISKKKKIFAKNSRVVLLFCGLYLFTNEVFSFFVT